MDLIVKHDILKNKDIDFIDLFNCDKFSTFLKNIKKTGCPNEIFELFVELLIMTHQAANTIGIGDYLPSISDNILAIGTDINLNPCAIKTIFKYENNQILNKTRFGLRKFKFLRILILFSYRNEVFVFCKPTH